MTRRDFIKNSAVLAGGVTGVAAGFGAAAFVARPTEAIAEVTSKGGTKLKVLDFRCRPPLKPYKGLYDLRLNFLAGRPNTLANPATGRKVPPSANMVGKPGAMEQWWKDLDAAGVDIAVANGRYAAGDPNFSMPSETLADLQKQYKGRFLGLAAINLDQPIKETVSELEHAITIGSAFAARTLSLATERRTAAQPQSTMPTSIRSTRPCLHSIYHS